MMRWPLWTASECTTATPSVTSCTVPLTTCAVVPLRSAGVVIGTVSVYNRRDVHRFGDSDLLRRPDWQITQAKLKIAFYPEAKGKRAKTINVELSAPNGSNLRDQTRRHQIVSEKYLVRWGLIEETMSAVA